MPCPREYQGRQLDINIHERKREAQKPEVREPFFLKWAIGFLPCFPFFPIHLLRVNWHLKWPLSPIQWGRARQWRWQSLEWYRNHTRSPATALCFTSQLIPVMGKLPHTSSFMPGVKKDGMRRAENYRWQWLSCVTVEGWVGKTWSPISLGLCLGTGIQELTLPPAPKAFYTRIIREGISGLCLQEGGGWCSVAWIYGPLENFAHSGASSSTHPFPVWVKSALVTRFLKFGLLARAPLCHIPGISSLTAVLASSFGF